MAFHRCTHHGRRPATHPRHHLRRRPRRHDRPARPRALAALPVQDEDRTGYERSKFRHWIDTDRAGCSTRVEVGGPRNWRARVLAMDQLRYSARWLSQWRDEITDAVSSMISTFKGTYGYEPGTNEVRVADEEALRAARDCGRELLGFEDLLTFYESIGEVVLPDVGNGYFVHAARDVLDRLAEEGAVFVPEADDLHGRPCARSGGTDGGLLRTRPPSVPRSNAGGPDAERTRYPCARPAGRCSGSAATWHRQS